MKSLLFRTGSGSISARFPPAHGSPRPSVAVSVECGAASPQVSLHAEAPRRSIRRSASEPDIIRSESRKQNRIVSRSFSTPRIPEVEYEDCSGGAGAWPVAWEELGSPGGGMNKNRNSGGGGRGGDAERNDMGTYYLEMIKSDPTNSLLLRNYGKYLHEVEGDVVKAEEYYGRAILSSPGDGEVLSLYGNLIWESERDESRANSYFSQALQASPNDCMVLGSYAHFLWEAEEEECEDDEEMETQITIPAMVEAF